MALTPRGKALRHLSTHRGITEDPANSNTDTRKWGIRRAQLNAANGKTWLIGTPWCGEWARWALQHARVHGLSYRQASVSLIEDDARAGLAPFFDWKHRGEWREVLRGDLVVLFGRGVHVETVRAFKRTPAGTFVVTDGGNTSSGDNGSQSNGGGAFKRTRALSDVHGFARVNYPGGKLRRGFDRLAMAIEASRQEPMPVPASPQTVESSDLLLAAKLSIRNGSPGARCLADDLKEALA